MWNHGGGVKGFNYDYSDNAPADNLVTTEFVEALEKTQNDGINFDLIAFDACLMGMIEVGYEIRNYTDYFVAAEEVVGGDGYDYTTAFSAFESEVGDVSPDELAQSLVQSFEEFYVYGGNDADTLSAVNTNELEELAEDVKWNEIIFKISFVYYTNCDMTIRHEIRTPQTHVPLPDHADYCLGRGVAGLADAV